MQKDADHDRANDASAAWLNVACGLIAIGLALVLPTGRAAQARQPEPTLRFEVTSIKRNASGTGSFSSRFLPGGRYIATNVTAQMLFQDAYRAQAFQIVGGPGWFDADHFDINATAGANTNSDQLPRMLQALLRERFHLLVHQESREMPVYNLVVARADGRLGPSLRPSSVDCATIRNGPASATIPDGPNGLPACGGRSSRGSLAANGTSMALFAANLSAIVNRTVVDRTRLNGDFNLTLTYTPETATAQPLADAASLFTALQEQLGLKLEAGRGPVEVFVIDRVEKPVGD